MQKTDVAKINPVTLAFLGDAVYALYVREKLVRSNTGKASNLQKTASQVLSAKGQSAFLERILSEFSQDEEDVYKRGRNAKKATKSKNADAGEYARSTGFEAVLGYLYLAGDTQRIAHLLGFLEESELRGQADSKPYKP
ncbi:MAG: Mini-ribonuclease 3 [Clostridia bacterium]|nr:Mini-ribonuclease 3 [Clostridia bacterium]